MAIKLQLKSRSVDNTLFVPRPLVEQALAQPDPGKALLEAFLRLPPAAGALHDAKQLENIVYWTPPADPQTGQSGLSVKEDAKWYGLRLRVAKLKTDREGVLTLNQEQYDLIKSRLMDEKFRVITPSLQWTEFVQMFFAAGGLHLPDVSDKLYEDLDELEAQVDAVPSGTDGKV